MFGNKVCFEWNFSFTRKDSPEKSAEVVVLAIFEVRFQEVVGKKQELFLTGRVDNTGCEVLLYPFKELLNDRMVTWLLHSSERGREVVGEVLACCDRHRQCDRLTRSGYVIRQTLDAWNTGSVQSSLRYKLSGRAVGGRFGDFIVERSHTFFA